MPPMVTAARHRPGHNPVGRSPMRATCVAWMRDLQRRGDENSGGFFACRQRARHQGVNGGWRRRRRASSHATGGGFGEKEVRTGCCSIFYVQRTRKPRRARQGGDGGVVRTRGGAVRARATGWARLGCHMGLVVWLAGRGYWLAGGLRWAVTQ